MIFDYGAYGKTMSLLSSSAASLPLPLSSTSLFLTFLLYLLLIPSSLFPSALVSPCLHHLYILIFFFSFQSHFWLPEEAAGRLRCGVCRLTFDVALKLRQQRQQLASNFTKCHTDNEPLEQRPRRATKIVPARTDSLSAI